MLTLSPIRSPSLSSTTSDADAELDATLRRKTRVALDHAILHLDCAANGIDDASELYEDAVTRPLDDAAVMHGDGGIDQIASQRSEAGKCPLLVGPGKLAESDHIRRKKAASFRVSAMAVPSPHARLARLLICLYRLLVQHLIQHLLGVASSARNCSAGEALPEHDRQNL